MIRWIADPILFSAGPVELRWYALCFVMGMIFSYRFSLRIFRDEGISDELSERLFIYVFTFGLIGARLGHVFFYEPHFFLSHPSQIPMIWKGGLASHGGAFATILACILFSQKYKVGFLWIADRISIAFLLLGGFIRFGNLFNSEIIGRPTDVPWAIIFSRVDGLPRHPTQIYEALFYFSMFFFMRRLYYKTTVRRDEGVLFGIFLAGVFSFRFLVEFIKENQAPFENALPLNMGQLLSLPLVLIGFWLIVRRKPAQVYS